MADFNDFDKDQKKKQQDQNQGGKGGVRQDETGSDTGMGSDDMSEE